MRSNSPFLIAKGRRGGGGGRVHAACQVSSRNLNNVHAPPPPLSVRPRSVHSGRTKRRRRGETLEKDNQERSERQYKSFPLLWGGIQLSPTTRWCRFLEAARTELGVTTLFTHFLHQKSTPLSASSIVIGKATRLNSAQRGAGTCGLERTEV